MKESSFNAILEKRMKRWANANIPIFHKRDLGNTAKQIAEERKIIARMEDYLSRATSPKKIARYTKRMNAARTRLTVLLLIK